MKGMGTNHELLIRVLVTRAEIDLYNVREIFGLRYGDGKTLKNWIEGDTSSHYCDMLSKVAGY